MFTSLDELSQDLVDGIANDRSPRGVSDSGDCLLENQIDMCQIVVTSSREWSQKPRMLRQHDCRRNNLSDAHRASVIDVKAADGVEHEG